MRNEERNPDRYRGSQQKGDSGNPDGPKGEWCHVLPNRLRLVDANLVSGDESRPCFGQKEDGDKAEHNKDEDASANSKSFEGLVGEAIIALRLFLCRRDVPRGGGA